MGLHPDIRDMNWRPFFSYLIVWISIIELSKERKLPSNLNLLKESSNTFFSMKCSTKLYFSKTAVVCCLENIPVQFDSCFKISSKLHNDQCAPLKDFYLNYLESKNYFQKSKLMENYTEMVEETNLLEKILDARYLK